MKIRAWQKVGVESATAKLLPSSDRLAVGIFDDQFGNAIVTPTITKSFYVGGDQRGYYVALSLTKEDLIEMLADLHKVEETSIENSQEQLLATQRSRAKKIIAEHEHQTALAKRRKAAAKRRQEKKRSGKAS